ncbi:MAG TPA: 5-formyltetrahydrofolate cyclo-ligase [Verrucomicrobiae bacterium]|nr:5-formyltetrahydrofolate cyclo-ligase [Verrucomicrobiae bacterium]
MAESPEQRKAALRAEMRACIASVPPARRAAASQEICRRLLAQPVWQQARHVLIFVPLRDEPDIWPLTAAAKRSGKTVALPRFQPDTGGYAAAVVDDAARNLAPGKFGIREPAPDCPAIALNRLDLVLVPALAFDWHGRRLGRGRGFYDRLLADVSGTTCGVALDEQLVADIPVEPHDILLNCILTPSHWLML